MTGVFTLATGGSFLTSLARLVHARFPTDEAKRDLSAWTILLPNRRSTRELTRILRETCGHKAMVMPRVRPIGDVDEIDLDLEMGDLPRPIPAEAQLFQLVGLVREWTHNNPHIALAQEMATSPVQLFNLAKSLNELIETVEVQERDFGKLAEAYEADLSEHRNSILSLLDLLRLKLPQLRKSEDVISATEHRGRLIRLAAERIAEGRHHGPIIAAGSTGTIPATRHLLAAIARHEKGAVILPGLDLDLDEESWNLLPQEHPQFVMKQLLLELGLRRSKAMALDKGNPRGLLASEIMRPSGSADKWHQILPGRREEIRSACGGLFEIAAPDRHIEARSIALILRDALNVSGQKAALVTPDQDLALRVTLELQRWGIEIATSNGMSLAKSGLGKLLDILLDACRKSFDLASRLAVLHDEHRALMSRFEAALRSVPLLSDSATFSQMIYQAAALAKGNPHAHQLVSELSEQDWSQLREFAANADRHFQVLGAAPVQSFGNQLELIRQSLNSLAIDSDWTLPVNQELGDLLEELSTNAGRHPDCSLFEAASIVQSLLRAHKVLPADHGHPRLCIYGTIEARLMPADVMILGGLNEGVWPQQPDTGPWLNRTMRDVFGLPQPERDIGLAAHDFEQGLGFPIVYLSWSKRLGTSPAGPARWLLRLRAVLQAAGLKALPAHHTNWVQLAQLLHHADRFQPHGKPIFGPPHKARPRIFSVTEAEKLIRNPYAIYARKILHLEPVEEFRSDADARLRGSLFHDIIGKWNDEQSPGIERLLEIAAAKFDEALGSADVKSFWWPHFERVADWLAEQERHLQQMKLHTHAEINGKHEFAIDGEPYLLKARADRIDVLQNGAARLIDYKTGQLPSIDQIKVNFSPQMTLEAAIMMEQGFKGIAPSHVTEAIYLRIGGGRDGLKRLDLCEDLEGLAQRHLAGFKALLGIYRKEGTPYLPRLREFSDRDEADYDHLSRYLEWQLAGNA